MCFFSTYYDDIDCSTPRGMLASLVHNSLVGAMEHPDAVQMFVDKAYGMREYAFHMGFITSLESASIRRIIYECWICVVRRNTIPCDFEAKSFLFADQLFSILFGEVE